MSAVSDTIVKEYFENLGFFVRQPRKYQVVARPKQADEEIDLMVFNPAVSEQSIPEQPLWGSAELRHISRAVVGLRGWHTERFSPKILETSPEIYRFAGVEAMKMVSGIMGEGPVAKILCLPDLPASKPLRKATLEILKSKGIDGVILFRTILLELSESVDAQKSYERSDLLQTLRILKNYDLLKYGQMDLFRMKRRTKDE
ncbi:MAG: hypothetical protein A2X46_16280 [Lentisphaerae bacterium GWF2_57_35]|nr:MAG: hypothetical protein A2X46_16280 [Lentisphaerae bacterium GWF2_57_35]